MGELTGRTALITGAGQNVGAEIARVLAARGATVGVNDLFADRAERVVEEIRAAGGKAEPVVADVTDLAAVQETFGLFGPIDILVNNAGIPISGIQMKKFVDEDPATWKAFVDLNVYGPLNCTHTALPGMLERGWGRVITISSESARVGDKLIATYAASKGAGPALMRSLAKEVGRSGITCNSISLATQNNAGMDEASDMALKQLRAYAVPRLGQAGDVAAAVAWLVGDDAAWVTGQTIPVNGGYATS
ncbi:SDR family NAD(P)-dependent oxidoreductase [Trujillonella endophytica]|uniref:3-oxoacyl-[acyl-carrier protein] reductase n=1 Tax=Trujillonella endophytica TaxID=673521 RepID=A0A1H8SWT3_9ACTN|nr:SDR family NAD(P)-dependent oxidoreductase [Trujillella endophytica]SEO82936.1 3-oxoacyl-[acyl-carrier protein] reductase [Trujillella endophytica]